MSFKSARVDCYPEHWQPVHEWDLIQMKTRIMIGTACLLAVVVELTIDQTISIRTSMLWITAPFGLKSSKGRKNRDATGVSKSKPPYRALDSGIDLPGGIDCGYTITPGAVITKIACCIPGPAENLRNAGSIGRYPDLLVANWKYLEYVWIAGSARHYHQSVGRYPKLESVA